MPGSTVARSCFRGLAEALSGHFSDESLREGYENAGAQIRELLESQPDVPVTQDSLAGFLNGFVLARTQCAELTDQPNDAMCQVIGGVYLLAAKAPLSGRPAQLEALRNGFYQRLSTPLLGAILRPAAEVKQRYAAAENAIRRIFGNTPDVPINRESLAGFVLGVMYSHRYTPVEREGAEKEGIDREGLTAIMVAAYFLADKSDYEPIRRTGPGPQ